MNTDTISKTDALFGGRIIPAQFNNDHTGDVHVRQLRLGDYEKAFKLTDDEIALTAFICGENKEWADSLCQESYERLQVVAREVNAGFFAFCQRRIARMAEQMINLPPEVTRLALEAGAMQVAGAIRTTTSPTSSPKWQRPAA